jgi:hypothetical protein
VKVIQQEDVLFNLGKELEYQKDILDNLNKQIHKAEEKEEMSNNCINKYWKILDFIGVYYKGRDAELFLLEQEMELDGMKAATRLHFQEQREQLHEERKTYMKKIEELSDRYDKVRKEENSE